jgi:dienelactone hydrolase
VPALLLVPKDLQQPAPAMLCLHPTSPLGKEQIAGVDGKPTRFYAHELAERGYVCLAPDYPSMGEYKDYDFAADAHESGTMRAIWDNIRGLDLLESLPLVDGDRIGAIGHSLGGHNGLFTAAFDERVRLVVTSCGFTAFHDYYQGDLKGWTSDRYMPRIAMEHQSNPDRVPFDFPEILGAIAPRPIFISAPLRDDNFDVRGVKKCVAAAGEIYKLYGKEQNLHAIYPEVAHDFPDDVRADVYKWIDQQFRR